MTEVKTGQVSQASDVMSDEMEAEVPILSAKDARTLVSSLVFGAMPHGQCQCAWISTSYVVGVQSGGNTITEWGQICSSSGDWIDEQGRPAASQAVGPASN